MFLSNNSGGIKEVDPANGNVLATYSIQGTVNSSGGGDLTFPPSGDRYLACFLSLQEAICIKTKTKIQITSLSKKVEVVLLMEDTKLDDIVVSASRTPERIKESPVTIERMTIRDIKKSASPTFYDGLENLKELTELLEV